MPLAKVVFLSISGLYVRIRPSTSADTATMIACAIVSARLNHCNSVLAGMSDVNITTLEGFRNHLAHVVTGIPAYTRVVVKPVLAKFHWLPVLAQATFKIAATILTIRQTRHPPYRAELIVNRIPSRVLQSTTCRQSAPNEFRFAAVAGAKLYIIQRPKRETLPDNVELADTIGTFRTKFISIDFNIANSFLFPSPRKATTAAYVALKHCNCICNCNLWPEVGL